MSTSRSSDSLVLQWYYHCGYKLREMGLWVRMKVINPQLNLFGYWVFDLFPIWTIYGFFFIIIITKFLNACTYRKYFPSCDIFFGDGAVFEKKR